MLAALARLPRMPRAACCLLLVGAACAALLLTLAAPVGDGERSNAVSIVSAQSSNYVEIHQYKFSSKTYAGEWDDDERYIKVNFLRVGDLNFDVDIDYWIYVCPPYQHRDLEFCNNDVAHPNTKHPSFLKGQGSVMLEAIDTGHIANDYIRTLTAVDFHDRSFAELSIILLLFEIKTPGIGYSYEAGGQLKNYRDFGCNGCKGQATATYIPESEKTTTRSPTATYTSMPTRAPTRAATSTYTPTKIATRTPTATRTPIPPPPPSATATRTPIPPPPTATATHTPTPALPPPATATHTPTPALPPPATATYTPIPPPTSTPAPPNAVVQQPSSNIGITVSGGDGHFCALHGTAGSILCWGNNERGQASPPRSGTYTYIVSGETHTCALRSDGEVVCWGSITVNP